MKKAIALTLALALALVLFTVAGCAPGSSISAAKEKTFALNDTATFKDIKVTANEIIINPGNTLFKPGDGKEFVAVKFTIENTSDKDQSISSLLLFDAYADDVKCSYSLTATQGLSGTLDGKLSPGKQLVGYYGVEVPAGTEKLILEVKSSWLSSQKAKFTFDVPAAGSDSATAASGDSTSADPADTTTAAPKQAVLKAGDTAVFADLKITANEIKINPGSTYIKPSNGNIFVTVKFTVENTSNKDQYFSTSNFNAYVNDIKVNQSGTATFGLDGTLNGSISSGKKLVGYYGVEIPKNTKKLDLEVTPSLLSTEKAQFSFDVPAA